MKRPLGPPQRADNRLSVTDEVAEALAEGRPVVALESTIISHGMPYPDNLGTANACEEAVRSGGAIPATVAVFEGQLRVGLDATALERLSGGYEDAEPVAKVSLRDLGAILASGATGATTAAATMFAATRAGIPLLATGGIGGIHRSDGPWPSHDISADLTALASLPVAVVCAGAKAVLDLDRTVEALETLGIPVIGQGTDTMPEFWTRGGNLPVSVRSDDPVTTAGILRAHWECGLSSGLVVANPIPTVDEADPQVIKTAIESGLAAAKNAEVRGRDLTPFLLARIAETTGGASLQANKALVEHNALVAAKIATALAGEPGVGDFKGR